MSPEPKSSETSTNLNNYENPWEFNGKPFTTDDIGKFVGFVYLIESLIDGKLYIGRKYFYSIRKVKGKTRRQRKESDWKTYYSSSDVLKEMIKQNGKENFKRTILSLHTTQGDCNYEEVRQQFVYNVLEDDRFLNENISGKYHRKPKHIIESRMVNTECSSLTLTNLSS
jgi:hypothetical protein